MRLLFRAEVPEGQPFGLRGSFSPAIMGKILGVKTHDGYPVYAFLMPGRKVKRWDILRFYPIAFYHLEDHGLFEYYLVGIEADQAPPFDVLPKYHNKIESFVHRNFELASEGDGKAVDKLLESFILDEESEER